MFSVKIITPVFMMLSNTRGLQCRKIRINGSKITEKRAMKNLDLS